MQETETHPSAAWVYEKIKLEFPTLSFATVYRNLRILSDQGLIKTVNFGNATDRFDANLNQHYHFICENCGSVHDLDLPIDGSLNKRVSEQTTFQALRHRIDFYGLCDKCRGKE